MFKWFTKWFKKKKDGITGAYKARKAKIRKWWLLKWLPKRKFSLTTYKDYLSIQMKTKAIELLMQHDDFYEPESKENKFIEENQKLMKWNAFEMAKFIIDLDHLKIFGILQEWFEHPEKYKGKAGPPAKVRVGIMMNLWLTNNAFNDHEEKIMKLVNMFTHLKFMNMIGAMFDSWENKTGVAFLEKVNEPRFHKGLCEKLSEEQVHTLFGELKKKNQDQYNKLSGMLPKEYRGKLIGAVGKKEGNAKKGKQEGARTNTKDSIHKSVNTILEHVKDIFEEKRQAH